MFVSRNGQGEITAVSREATQEIAERLDPGDPELSQFLHGAAGQGARSALRASDLEVVRVLEDLIEVLIEKGVIQFTELPEAAQKKLLQRKGLRRSSDLTLFDDDEGLI
jgi:hypothetical protein